jgi:hypothetical protein
MLMGQLVASALGETLARFAPFFDAAARRDIVDLVRDSCIGPGHDEVLLLGDNDCVAVPENLH